MKKFLNHNYVDSSSPDKPQVVWVVLLQFHIYPRFLVSMLGPQSEEGR